MGRLRYDVDQIVWERLDSKTSEAKRDRTIIPRDEFLDCRNFSMLDSRDCGINGTRIAVKTAPSRTTLDRSQRFLFMRFPKAACGLDSCDPSSNAEASSDGNGIDSALASALRAIIAVSAALAWLKNGIGFLGPPTKASQRFKLNTTISADTAPLSTHYRTSAIFFTLANSLFNFSTLSSTSLIARANSPALRVSPQLGQI